MEQPVAVNSSRPGGSGSCGASSEQRAGRHRFDHNDDDDVLPGAQRGGGGERGAGGAGAAALCSLSPATERPAGARPAAPVQTQPPPKPEPDCGAVGLGGGQQVGQPAPRWQRGGGDAAPLPPAGGASPSPAGQSAPSCHIGHIAGAEDGGGADGGADAKARGRLPAARSGGFLNAIEARLGDAIWDAFPLYLRAIGVTVQMGKSVEETKRLMARHLRANGLQRHGVPDDGGGAQPGDGPAPCWEIIRSPLGGRGVIATRDLRPGDLVLVDAPLALGPRAGSDPATPAVCVGCLQPRAADALRACSRGCRLPVCAALPACEDAACHVAECALLRRWGVKGDAGRWSDVLLRVASAVRCLALPPERREILASMQSHHGRQHASEVATLLELLESVPKPEEERFMRLACCVMDANAFRMTLPAAQDAVADAARRAAAAHTGEVSPGSARPKNTRRLNEVQQTWTPFVGALRGLYPLGALLNHECTPNTRHAYDAAGHMVIRAARAVAAGEELTVTYSALLWGSPARRQHLLRTKHFLCACSRCKDSTEGGTFLSALPCPSRGCGGPVLPAAPLSLTGPWRCSGCGLDVPAERATLLQSVLGGLLQTLYLNPAVPPQPQAILRFLEDNRHLLPATNHITVELKSDVVWSLGRKPGLAFSELSEEQLRLKEALIRELLGVLAALRAGSCSLSGMLQYELHCSLMERCRRDSELWPVVASDALHAVEVAHDVLAEDNAAPIDLADLLRRARLMPPPPSTPQPQPAPRAAEGCAPPPTRPLPPPPQLGAVDARPRSPCAADQEAIACL